MHTRIFLRSITLCLAVYIFFLDGAPNSRQKSRKGRETGAGATANGAGGDSSQNNSVESKQVADGGSKDARERERERAKELEREAERERERAREKEIRAFREFSTMLPIKQTRRSFVVEQQEAAAKAQTAALQAQWSSINGLNMSMNAPLPSNIGGMGGMSMGIAGPSGHSSSLHPNTLSMSGNGAAAGYLGPLQDASAPLGKSLGGPAGANTVGLHPVSPLHSHNVNSAALISAMNPNMPGANAGYGSGQDGYQSSLGANGLNSIMQQQMHIGEHLNNHANNTAAAAINMHGRKTPRSVALTMPPLDAPGAGTGAGASSGLPAHQRMRAGGRPQLSQPVQQGVGAGASMGAPWEASSGLGGVGLGGIGSSSPYATSPHHSQPPLQQQQQQQQQQSHYLNSMGAPALHSNPGALGALPNIMNSSFNNMSMGQQQQPQAGSRIMQQVPYGYDADFGNSANGPHQQQMHQQQHLPGPSAGAGTGYSSMQQQLNRRQVSRENSNVGVGGSGTMGLNAGSNLANPYTASVPMNPSPSYAHHGNAGTGVVQHQQLPPQQQQQPSNHRNAGHRTNNANANNSVSIRAFCL